MKQRYTEQSVEHSDGQQNIGNHKKPDAPDTHGTNKFGGTRTRKESVEKTSDKA